MNLHPDLFEYQVEGAQWLANSYPNLLLADEMRLGKTPSSIVGCDLIGAQNILVVCPGIARHGWDREFRRWQQLFRTTQVIMASRDRVHTNVVITSYDLIRSRPVLLQLVAREWDVLIADECFPSDTLISTNQGCITIGELFGSDYLPKAITLGKDGRVCERQITRVIRRRLKNSLVRVTHEFGSFVCTSNHKIFTDQGYVSAKDLSGRYLRILPEAFQTKVGSQDQILQSNLFWPEQSGTDISEQRQNAAETGTSNAGQNLRRVRSQISDPKRSRESGTPILHPPMRDISQLERQAKTRPTTTGNPRMRTMRIYLREDPIQAYTVLQQEVFSDLAHRPPAFTGRATEGRSEESGRNKETLWARQTNYQNSSTDVGSPEGTLSAARRDRKTPPTERGPTRTNMAWETRRQWEYNAAAGDNGEIGRYGDGIPYFDGSCKRPVSEFAALLQSRSSNSGCEISDRDRWQFSSDEEVAVFRQEEDRSIRVSRVVSVEVLEPGSGREPEESLTEDSVVFDLEVAGTHCYFANGCLVSNCHLAKNPTSLNAKVCYGNDFTATHGLASKAKRVWLLSGTPFPNGLHEMWTHCSALWPDAFEGIVDTYERWCDHYTITIETEYGTKIIANRNTDDFVERFHPYVLRRLRKDVQAHLPPLQWDVVPVSPKTLPPMPEGAEEASRIIQAALLSSDGLIADAEALLRDAHIASLVKWVGVAKAPAVAELINTELAGGMEKVVVFARHTEVFSILKKAIPDALVINGKTPHKDRQNLIDIFQGRVASKSARVLLCHIDIASTALDLTAAHDVIFAETPWVPKDLEQAASRCMGVNQTQPVMARIVTLKGSLDEAIINVVIRKAKQIAPIEQKLTTSNNKD